MKLIHDLAEAIKVPDEDDRSTTGQSMPSQLAPSQSSLMQTEDPMTNQGNDIKINHNHFQYVC